jgi:hypothetical protein
MAILGLFYVPAQIKEKELGRRANGQRSES